MKIVKTDGNDKRFLELCSLWGEETSEIARVKEDHAILLIDDGNTIGCGSFVSCEEEVAEMNHVYVVEKKRKVGAGKCIVKTLEKMARQEGVTKMLVKVQAGQEVTSHFLSSMGYEVREESVVEGYMYYSKTLL